MRLNPFYWLRIVIGKLVMHTTGTWIGSYVDDALPQGSEYKDFHAPELNPESIKADQNGGSGESRLDS